MAILRVLSTLESTRDLVLQGPLSPLKLPLGQKVGAVLPHMLVVAQSHHPVRRLALGLTYVHLYTAFLENRGTGGIAPLVPIEVGYDVRSGLQCTLPVAAGLINESLVEAICVWRHLQ